jgi:hypothetical protein
MQLEVPRECRIFLHMQIGCLLSDNCPLYVCVLTESRHNILIQKLIVAQLVSLWNPQIHYHIDKNRPYTESYQFTSHTFKINSNTILPSASSSSKLPLGFSAQYFYALLIFKCFFHNALLDCNELFFRLKYTNV